MNLDTVRMCAEVTARMQLTALGQVNEDVQALLDELNAPVVDEAPAPAAKTSAKKTKA